MQTPGEILKHQRQKLGKTIFEVSQETKILEKYIKQIENNQFDLFDSPVFARGFTKIYAEYLGLNVEKLLALFRRENKDVAPQKNKKKYKTNINITTIINPANITVLATTVFFVILITYFLNMYLNFQRQPKLSVITPINGFTSTTQEISVEGNVSKNSNLTVNGTTIKYTDDFFKYEYKLNEGENSIEVKVVNTKNAKKYATQILSVTYQQKKEETSTKPTTPAETFKISLKIKNDSTWVKLIIDDNQVYAQVLKSGFSGKFTAKQSVEIVSGKPNNTQVLINDELTQLIINKNTGVASLNCKLENSTVNCSK